MLLLNLDVFRAQVNERGKNGCELPAAVRIKCSGVPETRDRVSLNYYGSTCFPTKSAGVGSGALLIC